MFDLKSFVAASAATAALIGGSPAAATIILVDASSIQGDNVLFNDEPQTGTSVVGITNTSNRGVTFTAGGNIIRANGGQAEVTGPLDDSTPGPNDTLNFSTLTFGLTDGRTFNDLEFNLVGGDATSVSFTLIDNEAMAFNFTALALGNGSNFFGFQGIDGQSIRSISFTTSGGTGIQSIRQIRLDPGVVPEPATWALLLTGFGFIGAASRRRRTGGAVLS